MDNNSAERAIRPFTIGRKNWVNMFSTNGAQASAVIYSLVETARANNIRVYDYLALLLTELPKHVDDKDNSFIQDLLPWSDNVQQKCQAPPKTDINISMITPISINNAETIINNISLFLKLFLLLFH